MDEGVVIPVEDFVEAYNEGDWYDWGGYGTGASAAGGRPHQRPHHRPNRTVSTASTVGSPKPSPGGGGRKLTPLTQNQPWLEGRQNSHHFHDFQLLWTDEALGKLPVMTSGRVPAGGKCGEVDDVDTVPWEDEGTNLARFVKMPLNFKNMLLLFLKKEFEI